MKKNSKKLLILSSLLLVACGGGSGTSSTSEVSVENSSEVSTSESATSDYSSFESVSSESSNDVESSESSSSEEEVKTTVLDVINLSNGYFDDDSFSGLAKGDEYVVGGVVTATITLTDVYYEITEDDASRYVVQVNDKVYRCSSTAYDESNKVATLSFEITVPEETMTVYLCTNEVLDTGDDGYKVSLVDSEFARIVGADINDKFTGNFRAVLYVDPGFAPSKVEYRKVGAESWETLGVYFYNSMATIYGINFAEIQSDIEIKVSGEYVGVYNISYVNSDKVKAGYNGFPTVSQPGQRVSISFSDSNDYYVSEVPTITGLSDDALSDAYISTSSISFEMPENDIEITFNVEEKISINYVENANVSNIYCQSQAYSGGEKITKVKPGDKVYFFADGVSGYSVSGIKVNDGDLITSTTNAYSGLTYFECTVPENITEFNVSVVTEEASPVTIVTNGSDDNGCSVSTTASSFAPNANVKVSISSSAFYSIDEENVKVYAKVNGNDSDIEFTFGRDYSNTINSLSFTMPEEKCEVFVEINFIEKSTSNVTLSISDDILDYVNYISVGGSSSYKSIGNGETDVFISGEIIYVQVEMTDKSHEPTKLIISDADNNELATYDYYYEYGYGSFGDVILPEGDDLYISIEFKENNPLTYSITHDGIGEDEFDLQFKLDWSTTVDDLGTCYPGTQFGLVVSGDAGDNSEFIAYITDLDGNVISPSYGSYTVNNDFIIVVEKVNVVTMTLNIDESLDISYISISDDNYNGYSSGSSVTAKTHLSSYNIYSSVEFKCEVVCNGETIYSVSSTEMYGQQTLALDFNAPDSNFTINIVPVTSVAE